jgi:glucose dehydrogenase
MGVHLLRLIIFGLLLSPSLIAQNNEDDQIPDREPDLKSIPAKISDYYTYDEETGEWIWTEDYNAKKAKKTKKKEAGKATEKRAESKSKPSPKPTAKPKVEEDLNDWAIIAKGITKTQIIKKFKAMGKGDFDLCMHDKKTNSLDCSFAKPK